MAAEKHALHTILKLLRIGLAFALAWAVISPSVMAGDGPDHQHREQPCVVGRLGVCGTAWLCGLFDAGDDVSFGLILRQTQVHAHALPDFLINPSVAGANG